MRVKKLKKLELKKSESIFDVSNKLWFSGFCLTDNRFFSEFYFTSVPNFKLEKLEKMEFEERDLDFELGKEISRNDIKDTIYSRHFLEQYDRIKFFDVKSFIGKRRKS